MCPVTTAKTKRVPIGIEVDPLTNVLSFLQSGGNRYTHRRETYKTFSEYKKLLSYLEFITLVLY